MVHNCLGFVLWFDKSNDFNWETYQIYFSGLAKCTITFSIIAYLNTHNQKPSNFWTQHWRILNFLASLKISQTILEIRLVVFLLWFLHSQNHINIFRFSTDPRSTPHTIQNCVFSILRSYWWVNIWDHYFWKCTITIIEYFPLLCLFRNINKFLFPILPFIFLLYFHIKLKIEIF